jgi:hypothetical protein
MSDTRAASKFLYFQPELAAGMYAAASAVLLLSHGPEFACTLWVLLLLLLPHQGYEAYNHCYCGADSGGGAVSGIWVRADFKLLTKPSRATTTGRHFGPLLMHKGWSCICGVCAARLSHRFNALRSELAVLHSNTCQLIIVILC